MKISTAMALGRTLLKPLAGVQINQEGTHGCAWGMIVKAAPSEYGILNHRAAFCSASLPCECGRGEMAIGGCMGLCAVSEMNNLANIIVHLFNDHVMTRKDWTMDQLIDWVAAHEPPDPQESVTEHADLEKEIAYA